MQELNHVDVVILDGWKNKRLIVNLDFGLKLIILTFFPIYYYTLS